MSSITLDEASHMSEVAPRPGYSLQDRVIDQFFDVLPLVRIRGHGQKVNFADGATLEDHAAVVGTNGGAVPTTLPTLTTVEYQLAHLAARVEIDELVAAHHSTFTDIVRTQIDLKTAALLALYQQLLVTGASTNPGEFDGLSQLSSLYVVGANADDANGGPVLGGEIEETAGLLAPVGGVWNRYLVMRSETLAHLHRNNYSQQIFVIQHPVLGPLPSITGIPVLLNDRIPNDVQKGTNPNTTSIFAVNVGPQAGLYGLVPARPAGEITVRGPFEKENEGTVVFELTFPCGLATGEQPAVSAVTGVDPQT